MGIWNTLWCPVRDWIIHPWKRSAGADNENRDGSEQAPMISQRSSSVYDFTDSDDLDGTPSKKQRTKGAFMANSRPTANGYAPSATHLLKVSDVPAIRVPSQSRSSKPPATQLRRDSHVNAPFARSQINPTPGSQSSISETGCFSQTSCYSQSRTIAAPSYPGILKGRNGIKPVQSARNGGDPGRRSALAVSFSQPVQDRKNDAFTVRKVAPSAVTNSSEIIFLGERKWPDEKLPLRRLTDIQPSGPPAPNVATPKRRSSISSSQSSFHAPSFADHIRDNWKSAIEKAREERPHLPREHRSYDPPTPSYSSALSTPSHSSPHSLGYRRADALHKHSTPLSSKFATDMQKRIASNQNSNEVSRKVKIDPLVIVIDDDDDDKEAFRRPQSPALTSYLAQTSKLRSRRESRLRILSQRTQGLKHDIDLDESYNLELLFRKPTSYQEKIRLELESRVKALQPDIDFVDLSAEEEEAVGKAFSSGNPTQILSDAFRLQIMRKDLCTLKGLTWLNDEFSKELFAFLSMFAAAVQEDPARYSQLVANFFLEMVVDRSLRLPHYPKVYAFNTFFYPTLTTKGYGSVKRWTKKVDLFSHDMVIVPVHLSSHWCLAVIDFKDQVMKYFDSLGHPNEQCFYHLRRYLDDEMKDKKSGTMEWESWSFIFDDTIPQQKNMSDCGVFMLKFADFVSRNKHITFSQENMPYFRRRICWEILQKKLMGT